MKKIFSLLSVLWLAVACHSDYSTSMKLVSPQWLHQQNAALEEMTLSAPLSVLVRALNLENSQFPTSSREMNRLDNGQTEYYHPALGRYLTNGKKLTETGAEWTVPLPLMDQEVVLRCTGEGSYRIVYEGPVYGGHKQQFDPDAVLSYTFDCTCSKTKDVVPTTVYTVGLSGRVTEPEDYSYHFSTENVIGHNLQYDPSTEALYLSGGKLTGSFTITTRKGTRELDFCTVNFGQ